MPVVTEEQPTPGRRRGTYPKEFRKGAAALVIDQKRTVADMATSISQLALASKLVKGKRRSPESFRRQM